MAITQTTSGIGQSQEMCRASYDARWMILDCTPGYATEHDRLLVYSSTPFDQNLPWQENLDSSSATWVFDVGADERANLIINFHHGEDGLVADLYDDGDSDGQVSYNFDSAGLSITENDGNWTLRVIAPGGWWTDGSRTNFNLDILVDGTLQAMFHEDVRLPLAEQGKIATNGSVDIEIFIRDLERDGRPDYEWRQKWYPVPEGHRESGQVRTEIVVNTQGDELPFQAGLFWPYLSRRVGSYNNFHPKLPPIQVDWEASSIVHVAEFIALRMSAGTFNIYSKYRVVEGQVNPVDFENPFAFYDLSGANGGTPEMNIRFGHTLPQDKVAYQINTTPLNDIQLLWDQYNQSKWDYQVALSGRHEITEVIELPEFAVHSVPYDDLPEWIVSRKWDIAAFVQVERAGYYNSEIVWEWSTNRRGGADQWLYLSGGLTSAPISDFDTIAVGMRGEYAFEYDAQPYLYFSPVDRKLHLLGAQAGIFNLDGQQEIRYQNLGGDYINLWSLYDVHNHIQSLYIGEGHLVFWDADVVEIRHTSLSPALFMTLPPTDHGSWAALGEQLSAHVTDFAPDDFRAMLDQFGRFEAAINGASLRSLRHTQDGFRFVLALEPGFAVQGADLLGLAGTTPGQYAVTYDGAFHLEALTPAEILVGLDEAAAPAFTAHLSRAITLQLSNRGLEDAHDVLLSVRLDGPRGEMIDIEPHALTLLAGETIAHRLPFTPESPGEWTLYITLIGPRGDSPPSAAQQFTLAVAPAPNTLPIQDLTALGLIQPWQLGGLVLLLLLAAILLTALFADGLLAE